MMENESSSSIRTIARYEFLAEWYRGWAEIAGNEIVRRERLALAELMEYLIEEMKDAK